MACLSLLLPVRQTRSPRIDEPERRVTGAGPDVGGRLGAGVEGLAQGLGQRGRLRPGPRHPARVVRTSRMRVGPHQGLDPGGDVGPLGARGDEPARRVGRHRAGGLGAGDGDGLPAQGRYDLAGPGGVAPGAVLLELGVDAGPAGLPQRGGGGAGRRRAFRDGVVPRPRSQDGLQGGAGSGCTGPGSGPRSG